jgi:RNA polymerase sigma-70 factor (ECF subfamily)
VPDDRELHGRILTPGRRRSFQDVEVTLPPFERFYEQHRDEVFAFLVRRLGPQRAEDAFQETFLRALRAYPKLRHGEHLRAWAFTIAGRIAIDEHRRHRATDELPELSADEGRPAFAELEHLADELPPTERAAVVLRYGYDLDYADIGAALGSNATAARQAASAGIRRLRQKGVT